MAISLRHYEALLKERVRALFKRTPHPTEDDLNAEIRAARAAAGGYARADKAKQQTEAAATALTGTGTQTGTTYDIGATTLAEDEPGPDPYEEIIDELEEALQAQYGPGVCVLETYPDHVVYKIRPLAMPDMPMGMEMDGEGDGCTYWSQEYTEDEGAETFTFGKRVQVEPETVYNPIESGEQANLTDIRLVYSTPGASGNAKGGKAPPLYVQKMPAKQRQQWTDVFNSAMERCQKQGGNAKDCETAAFKQANGVVKASDLETAISLALPQRSAAYKKAMADCLKSGGNMGACHKRAMAAEADANKGKVEASEWGDANSAVSTDVAVALSDDERAFYSMAALRLADSPEELPEWQQFHKIGEYSIAHGMYGKIRLTREMGNQMIDNFHRGVVRKPITLNEDHKGGPSLAEMVDLRWGSRYQGLPGYPEPDGYGPILYARWKYNSLGRQKLADDQYHNQSPEYDLDYRDKETGAGPYGPTAIGCAATNNPYLRLRTWKGKEAPEPVLLTDGVERPVPEGAPAMADNGIVELAEIKLQLEQERKAREASDLRLAQHERKLQEERKLRHEMSVDAYLAPRLEKFGPEVAKISRAILLNTEPDLEGVVKLDEGGPAYNLHDLHKALLAQFDSLISKGIVTLSQDYRPNSGELDKQVQARAAAHAWVDEAGLNGKHRTEAAK